MGGPTNNAQSQNAAASQQIGQNTQQAQSSLAQYLAANPSILAQAPASINGAPQIQGGAQGGGAFGGGSFGQMASKGMGQPGPGTASPNMPRVPPNPGQPQAPAPQQGAPKPAGPPPPQIPPGLLALLGGAPRAPGQ